MPTNGVHSLFPILFLRVTCPERTPTLLMPRFPHQEEEGLQLPSYATCIPRVKRYLPHSQSQVQATFVVSSPKVTFLKANSPKADSLTGSVSKISVTRNFVWIFPISSMSLLNTIVPSSTFLNLGLFFYCHCLWILSSVIAESVLLISFSHGQELHYFASLHVW